MKLQDRMAEMAAEKQCLADESKKAKKLKEKRERYEKMKQELEGMEKEVLTQCEENDKLRGLPETIRKKRARDSTDPPPEQEAEPAELETAKPSKIPKKIQDYTDKFQETGNVRIDFVEGWNLPSQTSGIQMHMPQTFRDRILRNEFFSYHELHKAMNKKDVVSAQRAQKLMTWLEGQGTDPAPGITQSSTVQEDSIRLLDLVMMQTNFFTLYSQMYPKHTLTHCEHEYTLYEMIKQGYGMARMIEFDDMAHAHYMAKLGEPWTILHFRGS